eukprot:scaffold10713_cov108-Skeletonema_marinoi.AAC.2
MANYDGSLESVDCHIRCVRYDIVLESSTGSWRPSQSDASSVHLRRCSDADTVKMSLSRGNDATIPSWPTMMGH